MGTSHLVSFYGNDCGPFDSARGWRRMPLSLKFLPKLENQTRANGRQWLAMVGEFGTVLGTGKRRRLLKSHAPAACDVHLIVGLQVGAS